VEVILRKVDIIQVGIGKKIIFQEKNSVTMVFHPDRLPRQEKEAIR